MELDAFSLIFIGLIIVSMLIRVYLYLISIVILGAGIILVYSEQQVFIGIASYAACWILFFPLMLFSLSSNRLRCLAQIRKSIGLAL